MSDSSLSPACVPRADSWILHSARTHTRVISMSHPGAAPVLGVWAGTVEWRVGCLPSAQRGAYTQQGTRDGGPLRSVALRRVLLRAGGLVRSSPVRRAQSWSRVCSGHLLSARRRVTPCDLVSFRLEVVEEVQGARQGRRVERTQELRPGGRKVWSGFGNIRLECSLGINCMRP